MQSHLTAAVAREQVRDRLERADRRQRLVQTGHPPSRRVRWRAATAVARLAWRLDEDAAKLAVR